MGQPISALPPLELPVRTTDIIEVSRPRADDPETFDSFKCKALEITVGQATTTTPGIVELATNPETIEGIDPERAVTPAGLEAMIQDVLQNRIIQGPGISLSYNAGVLTIATEA